MSNLTAGASRTTTLTFRLQISGGRWTTLKTPDVFLPPGEHEAVVEVTLKRLPASARHRARLLRRQRMRT